MYGSMGCKMHNEFGRIFCVAPLDGIPFLSSFSKDEKKKLLSPEILLLQQLELFTITPELMKSIKLNAPPQSVGIRCRNCLADQDGCCFMKLASVSYMPHNLLLMAREHVVSCRFVKPKDSKVLSQLKVGNHVRLARFCEWLANIYSLEDSANVGLGVVWGKSAKLPAVYRNPADVDVSFCLGEIPNQS